MKADAIFWVNLDSTSKEFTFMWCIHTGMFTADAVYMHFFQPQQEEVYINLVSNERNPFQGNSLFCRIKMSIHSM